MYAIIVPVFSLSLLILLIRSFSHSKKSAASVRHAHVYNKPASEEPSRDPDKERIRPEPQVLETEMKKATESRTKRRVSAKDMRRAVVMSEIIGKPVSMRDKIG